MTIITKLSKKDFENILSNYNIGDYKFHKHIPWALSNTLYTINTTKGKYVIKIFETAKKEFINCQIKLMKIAGKLSPRPIKTIFKYNNKRYIIHKFVEGIEPKQFTDKLMIDVASKLGRLNKRLMTVKLKGIAKWEKDHQFKTINEKISDGLGEKKLLQNLKEINRKKLQKSIIHGDFHAINMLVKNNKLKAILDWDDAHEDYLVYEIAVFIMDCFILKVKKKQIRLFLKKYQKEIKLNDEEKKALYYFIKKRFLRVICWHYIQLKKHKDHEKHLKRNIKKITNSFHQFEKITLEEFLELT